MRKIRRISKSGTAVYFEMRSRPIGHWMILAAIYCGVWAIVFGPRASRAFVEIGNDAAIVRILGVLLTVGGVLATVGAIRGRNMMELVGLSCTAAGAAIYSYGVFIGLGVSGGIAGGGFAGLALGCASRVVLVARTARALYRATATPTE